MLPVICLGRAAHSYSVNLANQVTHLRSLILSFSARDAFTHLILARGMRWRNSRPRFHGSQLVPVLISGLEIHRNHEL